MPFKNISLPTFPANELPAVISDYVRAVAETTQTSLDMAATASLATLALSLQGKFLIEGKKDWREPLNLYTLVVAPPAERKSAVMAHMTEPLKQYEITENEHLAPLIEQNKIDKAIIEKKKKLMEDNLAKGRLGADRAKVFELSEAISEFKELKPSVCSVTTSHPKNWRASYMTTTARPHCYHPRAGYSICSPGGTPTA
jgi:hypothetical protein